MTVWDIIAPFALIALVLGIIFVPAVRTMILIVIGLRSRQAWDD